MDFIKNLIVSFFSGLIPTLMKTREKAEIGIEINHNKKSKIKDVKIRGKVSITDNEDLEIESGEFDG